MCSLKGFSQVQDFQDVSYFVLVEPEVVAHFVLHTVCFVLSVFFRGAMDGSASPGDQGAKPYGPLPRPLPSPFAFQGRGRGAEGPRGRGAEGPRGRGRGAEAEGPKWYQATENARSVR